MPTTFWLLMLASLCLVVPSQASVIPKSLRDAILGPKNYNETFSADVEQPQPVQIQKTETFSGDIKEQPRPVQLERDIEIWNNKTFTDKPVLTKEESNILKFRRWFSQFYSEHSPTYEKVMQGLEW